jgi:3',5'-cyclic AMP phosphodiesterase CpdA
MQRGGHPATDSMDDQNVASKELQPASNGFSRRSFVRGMGAAGLLFAAPEIWLQPDTVGVPDPEQIHLQFGSDASREVAVSWATPVDVRDPRVRLELPDGESVRLVPADTRTYTDAKSGLEVITHHAVLTDLEPATNYVYSVMHDGSGEQTGTFLTAPVGRAAFRFTSFGDQATPQTGNGLASAWAAYNPPQVEAMQPLFHLLNGDLCYANISPDRPKTWRDFFAENEVSARYRPWMPAAGNHENEVGNGQIGFRAYQTRFWLPDHGESNPDFRGMWYTFKAGGVRVISLNNDDVCLQDGGDNYVHGYSDGAQQRWLERTLQQARDDVDTDWIVVFMHQVAMSSAHNFNGADLGIRQTWLPLFDKYAVDLVLTGHEHHFERSLAVRGVDQTSSTLRPKVTDDNLDLVDTTRGAVHMIIGGGGTSAPSNQLLLDPARCEVIMDVGGQPSASGGPRPHRVSTKEPEDATWVGMRDKDHAWGFASFDVDPGVAGGMTRIRVRVWDTAPSRTGTPTMFDDFTLQRPRRDGEALRSGAAAV